MADVYRLPALIGLAALFFALAAWFGGRRGVTSMLGLASSVAVIMAYVVPSLAAGRSPLATCLVASFLIATLSLYLAHGFNARTTVAYVGTVVTLAVSAAAGSAFVTWARLFGLGSEDAFFLQGSGMESIDLRGLLLGGMILGALGILDDITTAQAAVVDELKHADPRLGMHELYVRGTSVGREHIASLVNTLFLAYAGAALPLFLLFRINAGQPAWFVVNSEMIAEEVVRTIVGSVCLVLAVPVTTALAAAYYGRPGVRASGTGAPHRH
jgi:uncharacterized membrane protein